MPYSGSISRDFLYDGPPEQLISQLLNRSDEILDLGYRIESHTLEGVVLARRVVPDLAYKIPIGVAIVFFILAMASSSTGSAGVAGTLAGISLLVAGLLSLTVRRSERLTLSANANGDATRILVSGTATTTMAGWIDGLDWSAANKQEPSSQPSEVVQPQSSLASRLGEWWERVA